MRGYVCRRRARRAVPLRSSLLAVEESAEAGVACAAYWDLGAVGEDGDVAVFAVGLDFGHSLQVDDVGAVDAHEARRVERGFQAGDGLLLQVLFAFGGEGDVVVLRFGIFEFGDGNYEDAGAVADGDAIEKLRRGPSGDR